MTEEYLFGSEKALEYVRKKFPGIKVRLSKLVPENKVIIVSWCDRHDTPSVVCGGPHDLDWKTGIK